MSRAACAKEIIDSALMGAIARWQEMEAGIMNVVRSPDFAELKPKKQEELIEQLIVADQDAMGALKRLTTAYESTGRMILAALDE